MTPVKCHSQPTQCAYIGLWRGAPPLRPPHSDMPAAPVQTRGRCGHRRDACGLDHGAPAIRECEAAGERCHPAVRPGTDRHRPRRRLALLRSGGAREPSHGGQRSRSRTMVPMVPAESATLNGKQAISRP